jgi:CheY-like chemotaxis protein
MRLGRLPSFAADVWIPRTQSAYYALNDARVVAMDPSDARSGRVLVIDDELQLCIVIRRTLGPEHEVTTVTSARQALELFDEGKRFDIVLCDLMMPEMTGMELHAELVRQVPEQARKMIFMTGGAFSEEAAGFLTTVLNPTVEKPFKTAALRQLVRNRMQ